jgi:hypothetical protein
LDISLFALVFFSAVGVLLLLYCLHFRYRALVMGPESLRRALSRATSGEDEAPHGELLEGMGELRRRLRRALLATAIPLLLIAAACVVLAARSMLPQLALALLGVGVFLASLMASLLLLRDILHFLSRHLEEDEKEKG